MPVEEEEALKIYLEQIAKVPLLTIKEEGELAELIRVGDEKARHQMITANLRLVVKIAQNYSNLGLSLLDLISEGNIGLMKAVERFDPNKGGKLSTYAAWWIKQGIKRALANQSKTIRLPVHMVDRVSQMRRAEGHLTEQLGRAPTEEEKNSRGQSHTSQGSRLQTHLIGNPGGRFRRFDLWRPCTRRKSCRPLRSPSTQDPCKRRQHRAGSLRTTRSRHHKTSVRVGGARPADAGGGRRAHWGDSRTGPPTSGTCYSQTPQGNDIHGTPTNRRRNKRGKNNGRAHARAGRNHCREGEEETLTATEQEQGTGR
jgi:RNA polymerase sigma factor (sigma-70 family)